MKETQKELLGDPDMVTAGKARLDESTGEYVGGIAFERDPSAISIHPNSRAYGLATSIQLARNLDAPHRGRKTLGKHLNRRAWLTRKILKVKVVWR
jgi:hypothetical protein